MRQAGATSIAQITRESVSRSEGEQIHKEEL
jgi:hypothetical protein